MAHGLRKPFVISSARGLTGHIDLDVKGLVYSNSQDLANVVNLALNSEWGLPVVDAIKSKDTIFLISRPKSK